MKYKLKTEGTFDSAHWLENYVGKCANLHGHQWRVVVIVESEDKPENGIIWDFTKLKDILDEFDHECLNKIVDFNPTAENIAEDILTTLKNDQPSLDYTVRVYESPKSYCEVTNE